MVRAYARLLKLDAEPMVERIAARVAVPDNASAVAAARRPIPITDSSRRGNLIYAALSLVILAVIAGVVFEWQRESMGAARSASWGPAGPGGRAAGTAGASTVAPPNLRR